MVLPIGGFMPIPLAMMIPFMATQSLVMGEAFGKAFQYGKRRISAMSNDEFNAYTPEQMARDMYQSYKLIIPDLKQSISASQDLQRFIVASLLDMPRDLLAAFCGSFTGETKETTFVPNSNDPADSRTWEPGWSPTTEQDFQPPKEETTTTEPTGATPTGETKQTQQEVDEAQIEYIIGQVNYWHKLYLDSQSSPYRQDYIEKANTYSLLLSQLYVQYKENYGLWYTAKTQVTHTA